MNKMNKSSSNCVSQTCGYSPGDVTKRMQENNTIIPQGQTYSETTQLV